MVASGGNTWEKHNATEEGILYNMLLHVDKVELQLILIVAIRNKEVSKHENGVLRWTAAVYVHRRGDCFKEFAIGALRWAHQKVCDEETVSSLIVMNAIGWEASESLYTSPCWCFIRSAINSTLFSPAGYLETGSLNILCTECWPWEWCVDGLLMSLKCPLCHHGGQILKIHHDFG